MNKSTTLLAVAGVLSSVILATTASAQVVAPARSNTKGFNIAIHGNGSAHQFNDSDFTETGGGVGLRLGWGVASNVLLFVGADAASVESDDVDSEYTLVHFDAGARITFGSVASAWRPYVEGAFSGRAAAQTFEGTEISIAGPGLTGGAGLQYFLTRRLALELGAKYTAGKYTDATIDGEGYDLDESEPARSARVNVGLSWHLGG